MMRRPGALWSGKCFYRLTRARLGAKLLARGKTAGSLLVFVVCMFLGPALARGAEHAPESSELRVCVLENNLPFSGRQNVEGFDIDTARAVAEELGRSFVPVWVKNDTRIIEVDESDFPLRRLSRGGCSAIFSIPGPEAVQDSPTVTVGAPYYGAGFELVGRKGAVPASLEALGNDAVAVQSQTIAAFILQAYKRKMQTYFTIEKALAAVGEGEVRVAFVWGPSAGWYMRNHSEAQLTFASQYTPLTVARWNEHVATRKSDEALREGIDEALTALRASGKLRALSVRYGLPFYEPFETTYDTMALQKLLQNGR